MTERYHAALETSLGPIAFTVDEAGRLTELSFGAASADHSDHPERCRRVAEQVTEYFAGSRTHFEIDLAPAGTPFQRSVWRALTEIPFGSVVSYADIARRIGQPGAARAVGQANGANPIPIVIPCHRVIAADGTIGGYSGGLAIKRLLLDLEHVSIAD